MPITTSPYYALPQSQAWGNTRRPTDNATHVMLLSNAYPVDVYNDVQVSSIRPYEITGTGYTAGGLQMFAGWIYDPTTGRTRLNINQASVWTNATFTARYAVVYDLLDDDPDAGGLYAVADFGADQSVSNDNFSIYWPSGIVNYGP